MKDGKNHSYWFKRRRYGYGWTPVTWQGWLTVVGFIGVVLLGAVFLLRDAPRNTFSDEIFAFLAFMVAAIAVLLVISLMKGPRPRWRWGSKSTDDQDKDI